MKTQVIFIDIDGLRADVFAQALQAGKLPHIARLLGGEGLERSDLLPVLAPAPSITFTSQACLFTGAHPAWHGIPGNQFFDRFGAHSNGVPRHYAFDVGDTLAADDAVRVFTDGLASQCLLTPTIYQTAREAGLRSVVASHMYAQDAAWLKPSLVNLARFTKGGNIFGMSSAEYDQATLENTIDEIKQQGLADLLTIYFMGLDHESHHHGPQAQAGYLTEILDGMIGELWQVITAETPQAPFVFIVSDHGQIGVPADDHHSLRLGFPFEREMGHLFDALGLDVHDYPGEDPNCDAVVASNGGLAHVYLQNRTGRWADAPLFERDVLPVARAFWEAHASGKYASELQGALAGVLLRNVERDGWSAPYQALTPQGDRVPLEEWFAHQPDSLYADPVNRLNHLAGSLTGDLLLVSNYAEGFYFASPLAGMHGGLHPEDSSAAFAYGWSSAPESAWHAAQQRIRQAIQGRCLAEGNRRPSTADLPTALWALLNE